MTIKFKHGKCYVISESNKAYEFSDVNIAKKYATNDDVVLIALPKTKEVLPQPDKIVLDFSKKTLTIDKGSATLNKVLYESGTHEMPDEELKEFSKLITSIKTNCKSYEIIGNPPVEGDIIK